VQWSSSSKLAVKIFCLTLHPQGTQLLTLLCVTSKKMLPLSLKALFEFLHIQQTFAAKAVVQLELLKRVESPEASSTYIAADGACE